MNWYWTFYWLTVADNVKSFFDATSNIFTVFTVLSFIVYLISRIGRSISVADNRLSNEEEDKKNPETRAWEMARTLSGKLLYPMLAMALVTWMGYVFTPTKKDCMLIVAGGAVGNFIQSDTSAASIPSDITNFLHLSLKKEIASLSEDEQKEIGVQSPKDELIGKVKDLSKEELIKWLESDSSSVLSGWNVSDNKK